MDRLHLRRKAPQSAPEVINQEQEQNYIDSTVTSLVQPTPGNTGTPASRQDHLPTQPWGGAIDLGPQLLETATTIGFGWPQALVSNTITDSASSSPPRGFTPSDQRDTPFSQLSRNTTSTESITSGLPQGFQRSTVSAASPTVESQPQSKRKRYTTQSQPPPVNTTGSAATHTRSSTIRRKSVSATSTSRVETEEAAEDEEQEKLRIYRERNRISAAKTRRRKKSSAKELEERAQEVLSQNEQLRQEERSLRDQLSSLRFTALEHDPTSNPLCHCDDIYLYNQRKAAEVAQNLR